METTKAKFWYNGFEDDVRRGVAATSSTQL
jgi:hypothetical protein